MQKNKKQDMYNEKHFMKETYFHNLATYTRNACKKYNMSKKGINKREKKILRLS